MVTGHRHWHFLSIEQFARCDVSTEARLAQIYNAWRTPLVRLWAVESHSSEDSWISQQRDFSCLSWIFIDPRSVFFWNDQRSGRRAGLDTFVLRQKLLRYTLFHSRKIIPITPGFAVFSMEHAATALHFSRHRSSVFASEVIFFPDTQVLLPGLQARLRPKITKFFESIKNFEPKKQQKPCRIALRGHFQWTVAACELGRLHLWVETSALAYLTTSNRQLAISGLGLWRFVHVQNFKRCDQCARCWPVTWNCEISGACLEPCRFLFGKPYEVAKKYHIISTIQETDHNHDCCVWPLLWHVAFNRFYVFSSWIWWYPNGPQLWCFRRSKTVVGLVPSFQPWFFRRIPDVFLKKHISIEDDLCMKFLRFQFVPVLTEVGLFRSPQHATALQVMFWLLSCESGCVDDMKAIKARWLWQKHVFWNNNNRSFEFWSTVSALVNLFLQELWPLDCLRRHNRAYAFARLGALWVCGSRQASLLALFLLRATMFMCRKPGLQVGQPKPKWVREGLGSPVVTITGSHLN